MNITFSYNVINKTRISNYETTIIRRSNDRVERVERRKINEKLLMMFLFFFHSQREKNKSGYLRSIINDRDKQQRFFLIIRVEHLVQEHEIPSFATTD